MHIVYSAQRGGFEPGVVYENPKYFAGLPKGTKSVTIVGHWPEVRKACEQAGVKVDDEAPAKSADDAPADGYPTDAEMRKAIEEATGDAPHWKCKRETLIAKYDEATQ